MEMTPLPRIGPLKAWVLLSTENPQQSIRELCTAINTTKEMERAWISFFATEEAVSPQLFQKEKEEYKRTLRQLVDLAEQKLGYYEIGSITMNRLLAKLLQKHDSLKEGMNTEEKKGFYAKTRVSYQTICAWRNGHKSPMARPFCAVANALNLKILPAFFPSFTNIESRFSSPKEMETWLLSFNEQGPTQPNLMKKDKVSVFVEKKRGLISHAKNSTNRPSKINGNKARQLVRNRSDDDVVPIFIKWILDLSQSNKKLFAEFCSQAGAEQEFINELPSAKWQELNSQPLRDLIQISIAKYGFKDYGYTNYAELIDFLIGDFEVLKTTNETISEFSHISPQTLVSWNTNGSTKPKDVYLYSISALYEAMGLSLDLYPINGFEAQEFKKGLDDRNRERKKFVPSKVSG